jgi:hypothetical protein
MFPKLNCQTWILWIALIAVTQGCDDRATQIARGAADRQAYNTIRPHSSLGCWAPAPAATQSCSFASAMPQRTNRTGILATPTLT